MLILALVERKVQFYDIGGFIEEFILDLELFEKYYKSPFLVTDMKMGKHKITGQDILILIG